MSTSGTNDSREVMEDARDLCRNLLQNDPQIPYKEVRDSAESLGLKVSRWMFSAVQRELAGTVGGGKPSRSDTPTPVGAEEPAETPGDEAAAPGTEAGADESLEPIVLKPVGNLKSEIMTFTVGFLQKDPRAPFKAVRDAAVAAGLTLYPISYGRAQALLGIVKAKPRRSARQRASAEADADGIKRRTLVQGATHPSTEVESFLDTAHSLAAERDRYRKALEALRKVLVQALQKHE